MVEEVVAPPQKRKRSSGMLSTGVPKRLSEIADNPEERIPLGIAEFARVLGGGIVPGSVVLIGGDPGIGKSTLLLQMALAMSERERVLYVSGEESERQLKTRAHRLAQSEKLTHELFILAETDLEFITQHTERVAPSALVIDSIQTMQFSELESSAGSITQVRECAARLQRLAKSSGIAVFLVGHVTKEGAIAGPRVMEHIVDTVLYLEGDPYHAYRILRSVKNRFGPTTEVGVFEMQHHGLAEVPNPSEAFLAERVVNAPGSAVAVTMEGTRPLLVEIQGLTSKTSFGNPRRTANGIDIHRLLLTVAVLSRRVGLRLEDQDIFINVVGGLQISEPAADLATAIALASSLSDKPVPADVALIGEVGLTGELRAVAQIPARLQEAAKLGFKRIVIPKQVRREPPAPQGLEIISARSVREVSALLLV
jgi:DNA repair protein RadA/Sms